MEWKKLSIFEIEREEVKTITFGGYALRYAALRYRARVHVAAETNVAQRAGEVDCCGHECTIALRKRDCASSKKGTIEAVKGNLVSFF